MVAYVADLLNRLQHYDCMVQSIKVVHILALTAWRRVFDIVECHEGWYMAKEAAKRLQGGTQHQGLHMQALATKHTSTPHTRRIVLRTPVQILSDGYSNWQNRFGIKHTASIFADIRIGCWQAWQTCKQRACPCACQEHQQGASASYGCQVCEGFEGYHALCTSAYFWCRRAAHFACCWA